MTPRMGNTHAASPRLSVLSTAIAAALALGACHRGSDVVAVGAPVNTPQACAALATSFALPPRTRILAAAFEAATPAQPAHCRIDGDIDDRTGVDGQRYATRFRLRMPQDWNRRF